MECSEDAKRMIRIVVYAIFDFLDFACNWCFFVDVCIEENGLVYGKTGPGVVWSILAFTILGTGILIVDFTFLVLAFKNKAEMIDNDIGGVVVVWFCDMPLAILSLIIAVCREETFSIFQIAKAGIIIFNDILRFIIPMFTACCSKDKKPTMLLFFCIGIGILINLVLASFLSILTIVQFNADGYVEVSTQEDQNNEQRYFRNVGIFISHPAFNNSGPTSTQNWMRVASIDDIRNPSNKNTLFLFEYKKTDQNLSIVIQKNEGYNLTTQCYSIGEKSSKSCIEAMDSETFNRYTFRFTFIPPEHIFRKTIFGNIKFNYKHYPNGNCDKASNDDLDMDQISVHYFRTAHAKDDHLVLGSTGVRFYREEDLTDVRKVWKTGLRRCEPSGYTEPLLDISSTVPCQINISKPIYRPWFTDDK